VRAASRGADCKVPPVPSRALTGGLGCAGASDSAGEGTGGTGRLMSSGGSPDGGLIEGVLVIGEHFVEAIELGS
jgi:hypothetical protein